jgi:hypothetical protein
MAVVLITASLMALGAMQTAFAAVSSQISIAYNHDTGRFHGKVTSSDPECQAGRTVRLFKRTADGRRLKGRTLTNHDGRWRIAAPSAHGHFFAVTPEELIMDTMCGGDRSRTIDVM